MVQLIECLWIISRSNIRPNEFHCVRKCKTGWYQVIKWLFINGCAWILYYDPPWNGNSLKATAMFFYSKFLHSGIFCMYYFRVYRGTLCSQYPLCTKYFSQCSLLCTIDFWFLARGSWLRGPLQQIHFVNLLVATFFSSPAQTEWIYFMHFHSI